MATDQQPGLIVPLDTLADDAPSVAAVLPVGSYEQHGPALPYATDTLVACVIAAELAAAYPVRRLPAVTMSCSHEHAAWPGTLSLSATTLALVVRDIAASLPAGTPLVVVNGHGGNYVLQNVVQESAGMAMFPGVAEWQDAHAAAGLRTPLDSDMHAGELETSILLAAVPHAVRPGYAEADHLADDRRHLLTTGLRPYTESGVVGRPSAARQEKGRALLAALVASFADHLAVLTSTGERRSP
ncbi:MAG: creatininase family protein [Thermocrispum sp.]